MLEYTDVEGFRAQLIKELALASQDDFSGCKRYESSSGNRLLFFQREKSLSLCIFDYQIPHDIQLTIRTPNPNIHFGIIYKDKSVAAPSTYFMYQQKTNRTLSFKKGQKLKGIELFTETPFLDRVYQNHQCQKLEYSTLTADYLYLHLPVSVQTCLQELFTLFDENLLNELYMEGKLLELFALLHDELLTAKSLPFSKSPIHGYVLVGNRTIRLSDSDIQSIEKAHQLLSQDLAKPPTIEQLSQLVLLNPQKLKAGFLHHYHTTIGDYMISLRMTAAANQLSNTGDSVSTIAKAVGYTSPASFIKMFKKVYKKTPLQYRFEGL